MHLTQSLAFSHQVRVLSIEIYIALDTFVPSRPLACTVVSRCGNAIHKSYSAMLLRVAPAPGPYASASAPRCVSVHDLSARALCHQVCRLLTLVGDSISSGAPRRRAELHGANFTPKLHGIGTDLWIAYPQF